MLTQRLEQRGFTLIELLVGLAIIGILLTQAMPNFSVWMKNSQIRTSAESILNGLQLARAQALRTNLNTEFILTATDPTDGNVGAVVADVNGTNWMVRNATPMDTLAGFTAADFVQGRSGQEGSVHATIVAGQASFIFTPLGRLLNPPAADIQIIVSSDTAYTGRRQMAILVSTGGQVLMCDPAYIGVRDLASTPAQFQNNPQFCP